MSVLSSYRSVWSAMPEDADYAKDEEYEFFDWSLGENDDEDEEEEEVEDEAAKGGGDTEQKDHDEDIEEYAEDEPPFTPPLDLSERDISVKDVRAFLEQLTDASLVTDLVALNLAGNKLGRDLEPMEPLLALIRRSKKSLTGINLARNHMCFHQPNPGVALAECLGGLKHLKVLDMSACCLLGADLRHYRALNALGPSLRRLTHLRLAQNDLHSEGCGVLAGWVVRHLSRLRYLDLSRNPLTRDSLGHSTTSGTTPLLQSLRLAKRLRELTLRHCELRDEEGELLAGVLTHSVTLKSLDVSCNALGQLGAKALAQAIRNNASLLRFRIDNNRIEDQGVLFLSAAIGAGATSLEDVDLSHNGLTPACREPLMTALKMSMSVMEVHIEGAGLSEEEEDDVHACAMANAFVVDMMEDPVHVDLQRQPEVVAECILFKLQMGGVFPLPLVQALKLNPSFMQPGPLRTLLVDLAPVTKRDLLVETQGALERMMVAKKESRRWMKKRGSSLRRQSRGGNHGRSSNRLRTGSSRVRSMERMMQGKERPSSGVISSVSFQGVDDGTTLRESGSIAEAYGEGEEGEERDFKTVPQRSRNDAEVEAEWEKEERDVRTVLEDDDLGL